MVDSAQLWFVIISLEVSALFHRRSANTCKNRIPAMICSIRSPPSDLMYSPNCFLYTADTFETSTTLCLGKPASPASSSTLPGDFARRILVVSAQTITVWMRLRLNTSKQGILIPQCGLK